jgi:hypothetical protein
MEEYELLCQVPPPPSIVILTCLLCQELGAILDSHDDREYENDSWYTRHQRTQEQEEAAALKALAKTDKLHFDSLFERLAKEQSEEETEVEGGLFAGTGMFECATEEEIG